MAVPELTPPEIRVLGSLVEKAMTTPDQYPLTLNALVHACNQKSSRFPVVDYDEKTVVRALDHLRQKKLALLVSSAGGRVPKYEHSAGQTLCLSDAALALLAVLMLRGPQTVGELRTRTARMHTFGSLTEVQDTLDELCEKEDGLLLKKLPRQTGRKECRYAQLLGGEPELPEHEEGEAAPEPARQAVQAEDARIAALEEQVRSLNEELAALRSEFESFRDQF